MRVKRPQGLLVSLNGTSIIKAILLFNIFIIILFIISGMLTSLKPEYRLSSSSVNQLATNFSGESLIHVLGFENRYFTQALPKETPQVKFSSVAFEMATNINPDDPRSLLGRELPGFSLFDGKIIIAGEGTNYTNMPYESAPPLEVLLEERQASTENLNKVDKPKEEPPPVMTTHGRKVVYIYHTHSRESYLPQLENVSDPDEAFHGEVNVTKVGERLSQALEKRGIGSTVDKSDFTGTLLNKGWNYGGQSYDVSRPAMKEAIASNKDLTYFIDIHRDSLRKKNTTVHINNVSYARISFVIGGEHSHYEKNQQLAIDLHHLLEEKYPGLSRGVITKQGPSTNGKFNQDLSESAILIEFGGVDNNLKEVYRAVEAVADVFSKYYWKAEKVSQTAQ